MDLSRLDTLRATWDEPICTIQIHRPEANNTITPRLIEEMHALLDEAARRGYTVVVLRGLPEVFCFGADFRLVLESASQAPSLDPERLYDLYDKLWRGPYVSVAAVQGRANAGGVGFVCACNIALADPDAKFSLSELLFGLIPACVMPFLVQRVGLQRASALTLLTQPVIAEQAQQIGLVDACEPNLEALLRRHLLSLRRLSRRAIVRHKDFLAELAPASRHVRDAAVQTNRAVFSDPENLRGIEAYVRDGLFPWEHGAAHGR